MSNLDKELEKAKREFKNHPSFSKKQYKKALKAMAKMHGMTVKEFNRMLDKEMKRREDIDRLVEEDMAKMEAERKRKENH